jgi:hypothetical protein
MCKVLVARFEGKKPFGRLALESRVILKWYLRKQIRRV